MSDFYSKRNPLGPYAPGRTRPNGPTLVPEDYIEGESTKKNLAEWAEYAKRNSFPASFPDTHKPKRGD